MTDVPLTPGHRLNSAIIKRDLHRLLCAFLAMQPIKTHADSPTDPLTMLNEFCLEDEITHLLVSTAAMNRAQLEHMYNLRHNPDEISWTPLEGYCGSLWKNAADNKEEKLSFKEACNKIIHAVSVEIFDPRKPFLRVHGQRGHQNWMANIEVLDYVRLSVRNFDDALL